MDIKKYHIYIADLSPRMGTETGKVRPVVVVQTNLLNNTHPSAIICPVTTNVNKEAKILRVHLNNKTNNLNRPSDILVDQVRAIDNKRFKNNVGKLTDRQITNLMDNLKLLIFE